MTRFMSVWVVGFVFCVALVSGMAPRHESHRRRSVGGSSAVRPIQFQSAVGLYKGSAPRADWASLPFGAANATVYDASSDRFLVLDARGGLWTIPATTDGPNTDGDTPEALNRFSSARDPNAPPPLAGAVFPCFVTAVPANSCMDYNNVSYSPLCTDNSTVLITCQGQVVLCAIERESGVARCHLPDTFRLGRGAAVNSASAVAFRPVWAVGTTPNPVVLVAATSGVLTFQPLFDGSSHVPRCVAMSNTTGAIVCAHNVTQVYCLPSDALTTMNAHAVFGGGQCFATTSTTYCLHNICPANQIHVLSPVSLAPQLMTMQSLHAIRIPGVIDARPPAMAWDEERRAVHMPQRVCLSVLDVDSSALERIGGYYGGLPIDLLTGVAVGSLPARDGEFLGDATPGSTANTGKKHHRRRGSATTANTNRRHHRQVGKQDDGGRHSLLWLASEKGAAIWLPDGSWKYLFGPRWMPAGEDYFGAGNNVSSVAADRSGGALLLTDSGVVLVSLRRWAAWSAKAEYVQSKVPLNLWYFNLIGDVPLASWGNASSSTPGPNCNHGLWTSMYVASQIFAYQSTGNATYKDNAWASLRGMQALLNVTGVPGVMARSLAPTATIAPGSHNWYESPTMPGFSFMGNPSSDEVTGHMHVYGIAYDLIADTDDERAMLRGLIDDIVGGLVEHNLTLFDVTGKATQWGRWNPVDINDDPFWYDERGVNSMQILSYLSTAYRVTGNETYASVFYDLVENHGYHWNMVNLKITQPDDVDFSDDELIFLAYLGFLWSGQRIFGPNNATGNPLFERTKTQLLASVQRTFNYVIRERPDLWSAMYLMFIDHNSTTPSDDPTERATVIADAYWGMKTWPMSLVGWPTDNGGRLDVRASPHRDRNNHYGRLLRTLLPYDEVSTLTWNGDPFDKQQGSGWSHHSPAMYLYPAWLLEFAMKFF